MQIVMPKLGLTMTEGTISRWLVAAGQAVKQGEILFEFESEKSVMEFESPKDGADRTTSCARGRNSSLWNTGSDLGN